MRERDRRTAVITGATGFLGRELVRRLRAEQPERQIVAIVRGGRGRKGIAGSILDDPAVRIVDGDIAEPFCGIDSDIVDALRLERAEVYHLAARYDLGAEDRNENDLANVIGTHNTVALAEAIAAVAFHHASTIAVAGDYHGTWTEEHFAEATEWRSDYGRSKHEAERVVRASSIGIRGVYRFGVLVGDEETGCRFKADGVYRFFPAIRTLAEALPRSIPVPTLGWGAIPLCPVDRAARALLALADDLDDGLATFHVFDEEVLRADDVLRTVLAAAGHSASVDAAWVGRVLHRLDEQTRYDGVLASLKDSFITVLQDAGVPTELLVELNHPTLYVNARSVVRLERLGIVSTPFDSYVHRIWHSWLAQSRIDEHDREQTFFQGRRVLLTGGTSGVGRAILCSLVDRGAEVVVAGRSVEKFGRIVADMPAHSRSSTSFVEMDLLDSASVAGALAQLLEDGRPLDSFIHSAGVSIDRPIAEMSASLEEVDRMTAVNFVAPLRIVRSLLKGLRADGDARVVTLSSISTEIGIPGFAAYSATKDALDQAFRVLPGELLESGIRFVSVKLPLVKSPMTHLNPRLRDVPMMSESAAAAMVVDAMIAGRSSQSTTAGRLVQALSWLFPRFGTMSSVIGWKLFLRVPYFARIIGAGLTPSRS